MGYGAEPGLLVHSEPPANSSSPTHFTIVTNVSIFPDLKMVLKSTRPIVTNVRIYPDLKMV